MPKQPKLNLELLGDYIAVVPDPAAEKTEGGLYVPDSAKEKPNRGTVIGVGNGITNLGKVEVTCKVGDRVYYSKGAGIELTHDGITMLVFHEYPTVFGII